MDNLRVVLYAALAVILFFMWQAWQRDYAAPIPAATAPATQPSAAPPPDVPAPPQPRGRATDQPVSAASAPPESISPIRVQTDVLQIDIDPQGGDIRHARLLKYPVSADKPQQPVVLMDDQPPQVLFTQSGLLSKAVAPNHHARYRSAQDAYRLAADADRLQVTLDWQAPDGLRVSKVYTFQRGSYVVELAYRLQNSATTAHALQPYYQLQRGKPAGSGMGLVYTYTGGVLYSPEDKYQKIDFDDMAEGDLQRSVQGGWVAMIQHYFLSAWIPDAREIDHYYTKAVDDTHYVIGFVAPEIRLDSGAAAEHKARLYLGPKRQDELAKVAPGLELTIDYGILTVIAQPIFWLMKHIHGWVGNWGAAIILLTLLIKLVFYKLSETSYRSMANMRRLQPRLMALKERYGDDRQRMQQAMMEMYKTEKINPLGGCLPILVQVPVFIALYWVLLESVELRQAPLVGWIKDLSAADPYFVLPIIMGATMLIQQRLSPAPLDPIQQKVMMAMPIVFTAFFAFFPAGLVLYWVVNNTLSIAQQWMITRRVEQQAKPA